MNRPSKSFPKFELESPTRLLAHELGHGVVMAKFGTLDYIELDTEFGAVCSGEPDQDKIAVIALAGMMIDVFLSDNPLRTHTWDVDMMIIRETITDYVPSSSEYPSWIPEFWGEFNLIGFLEPLSSRVGSETVNLLLWDTFQVVYPVLDEIVSVSQEYAGNRGLDGTLLETVISRIEGTRIAVTEETPEVSEPILSVDWTRGELRPSPRKNRPNRKETYYPATCQNCGEVRYLRGSDARKGSQCKKCQTRAAGKLGYAATVQKYGSDFALECLRKYRLEHPSKPEQTVAKYLSERGIAFEREFRFDGEENSYLLDFVLLAGETVQAVIQVDGWQHQNRPEVQERDQRLNREIPFPLLRLNADRLELDRINFLLWETI